MKLNWKKIAAKLAYGMVFILSIVIYLRFSNVPHMSNILLIPIILTGYFFSTALSVFTAIAFTGLLFASSGELTGTAVVGLTIQSIFFIVIALASGLVANMQKSKTMNVAIEKRQLQSLNKVSTNFLASLEPAAVFDQFTREARRLLAADASALVRLSSTARILAEENIEGIELDELGLKLNHLIREKSKGPEPYVIDLSQEGIDLPYSTVLVAPVVNKEMLFLFSTSKRNFTRDEIDLLSEFIDQAVVALNGANYYAAREKQSRIIKILADLNRAAASLADIEELSDLMLSKSIELFNATGSALVVIHKNRALLQRVKSHELMSEEKIENLMKTFLERRGDTLLDSAAGIKVISGNTGNEESYHELVRGTGFPVVVGLPLIIKDKIAGFIFVFFAEPVDFDEDDMNVIETAANEFSMVLYNSRLLADIKNLTLKTVESIAAAFDAANEYTKGHSIRVARYATKIAERIGLSVKEIREIQYAALLHDMGRIFLDEDILNAPRKLTPEEIAEVKKIPLISSKIFEKVNFFSQILPLIMHHKERYDGTGYPSGLKGEEIPLGARIIAIAEAYVAMTSRRPFREPLPPHKAAAELLKNAGTQFDPVLVKEFLHVLEEEQPGIRFQLKQGAEQI